MQKSYITDTNKIRLFAKILLLRLGRLCHCGIVLDTVISVKQLLRMNQMLILPHIPKDFTSQPKVLKLASGILSAFEQIKQNSSSDPLFSIPSTKQRI